jgi:SRSO17 transposase
MSNTTLDLSAPIEDASRRIAPCFGRSETRARSRRYVAGLLSITERKNGWQLAEDYAYYRVYGPEATSLPVLIAVAGQRWQIEAAFFEGAKGEVGLDEYEVRLAQARYRHITLALLAYATLVVARSITGKKGT